MPSGTRCVVRAPRPRGPQNTQPAACSPQPAARDPRPATCDLRPAAAACTHTHLPRFARLPHTRAVPGLPALRPPASHQSCAGPARLPACLTPPRAARRRARGVEVRRGGAACLQVAREGAPGLLRRHVRQGRRPVVEVSTAGRAAAGAPDAQGGHIATRALRHNDPPPPPPTPSHPPPSLACPPPPTTAADHRRPPPPPPTTAAAHRRPRACVTAVHAPTVPPGLLCGCGTTYRRQPSIFML
jgi:hypothetical protein